MDNKNNKKEFLEREEIKTMTKDIADIQEKEALAEREKIKRLKINDNADYKNGKSDVIKEKQNKSTENEKSVESKESKISPEKEEKTKPDNNFIQRTKKTEEKDKIVKPENIEETNKQEIEKIKQPNEQKIKPEKEEYTPYQENEVYTNQYNKEELDKKRVALEEKLKSLRDKKEPINLKKTQLSKEIDLLKKDVGPILKQKEVIQRKKEEIETEEANATTPTEKRAAEKKRWDIEEKIREIETKEWTIEEKIEKIKTEIEKENLNFQNIIQEEEKTKKEIDEILKRKEKLELEKEKKEIEKEISLYDPKIEKLSQKEKEIEDKLRQILITEKEIEDKIRIIEEKEKKIQSPIEKEEIEKEERWKMEDKRKEIESQKWELEDQKNKIKGELKKERELYQNLLNKEEDIDKKIQEIRGSLDKQTNKKEQFGVYQAPRKLEEKEKPWTTHTISNQYSKKLEKKEKPKSNIEKNTEKIINEIKPSEKEEKEAIKSTSPKSKTESNIEKPKNKTKREKSSLLYPPDQINDKDITIKRKNVFLKLLVRIIVIFIILAIFVITVIFWQKYVKLSKKIPHQTTHQTKNINNQNKTLPNQRQESENQKVKPSASIIPDVATTTIKITNNKELPKAITTIFNKKFPDGQITRILIKNTTENKFLDLKEFLDAFQITPPLNFYSKIDNNFTLFIDSSAKTGNSLGFISKLKDTSNIENSLKLWEKYMENDFKNLFIDLNNNKEIASHSHFIEKNYKKSVLHYMNIYQSPSCFGICYGVYNNYFIFSTCCNSNIKIINILSKKIK